MKKTIFVLIILIISFGLASGSVTAHEEYDYSHTVEININEDGSANWEIKYVEKLENDTDINSYNEWVDGVTNSSDYKIEKLEKFNNIADIENINRSMNIQDMNVSAHLSTQNNETIGTTKIEFTWSNFADITEDDEIHVGDVFVEGYNLQEDERLIISWDSDKLELIDSNYAVQPISENDDYILWVGQGDFDNNEPTLLFQQNNTAIYLVLQIFVFILFIIFGIKIIRA